MVPAARFSELLADIEPSATTKDRASSAHNAVRKHLEEHDTFSDRWVSSFLSGSYARSTSIRPTASVDGKERPDVDIIVVTNFTEDDTPEAVLKEVRRALEDGDDGYPVERTNKRSVRVETWQAEMDIVPVIEAYSGYKIADRETGEWQFTNPPKHTTWSSENNLKFDGRFKPLVKLFKWWRRINPSGRRPKGFVLEVLVSLHAPKNETHYGEAFAQLLENVRDAYSLMTELGTKPAITDPANPAGDILSKVTLPQWKDFLEKVRVYADVARRAQNANDDDEATRLWTRVFGDRFDRARPKPKVKAESLATQATAPAAATVGYTFPDKPVAPTTPRGFA
ncbi:SMODS domain-containing nucleotidyltransferase [Bradyrhizobium septentrionale]|uniref:Nucleotidyltransferase n=1 Tax=Bradyrhizobium septentrionale TaxID=1404411 RepID=A0ABZ2P4M6_9BRAD